jgi:site-specific recombinase XerD
MFWVDGVLAGREVRLSLDTRDVKRASQKVHEWEAKERVVEREATVTLADAWTSMIGDLEARKLSHETIRKYKLLERQMKAYGVELGLTMIAQFDLDVLSCFRARWKDGPRTSSKKLERLRAFFRFAHDRQWIETNPASKIKLPKVSVRPTMPLTQEEMVNILTACDTLQAKAPMDGKLNAHRLKTLVLLMRYTGMRVSDAVTLTTDRLSGKRLFLYTQKTGVPVYTVLPESLRHALDAMPRMTETHYFRTGIGKSRTVVTHWQRRLKKLFDTAKVSKSGGNAVSHRFRDTFAVELLLAGVPIERVSILLGHQSVRVTEKHYNPWVRSRQEQLEADVASAWTRDPLLSLESSGTNSVHLRKERYN